MDAVVTHTLNDRVSLEELANGWLDPGQPQGHTRLLSQLEDLVHLRRALGVDELDGDTVEDDPDDVWRRQGDVSDPVLQRVRRGEEQPAIEAKDHETGELLVPGIVVQLPEHPRIRSPS